MLRWLAVAGLLLVETSALADSSGRSDGGCRLTYNPMPPYPKALRRAYFAISGQGTFLVSFDSSGSVREVKVVRSTTDSDLDTAAIATLRKWKSAPGRTCSVLVPVKFDPGATVGF